MIPVSSFLTRGRRRVDRDDDADQLRQRLFMRPARRVEEPAGPQRAWHVVEELGEQLLATEAGPLIALHALEDLRRDIADVLVGGAAGDDDPNTLHQPRVHG